MLFTFVYIVGCKDVSDNIEVIDFSGYKELPMSAFDFQKFESRVVELRSSEAILGEPIKVITYKDKIYVLSDDMQSQSIAVYTAEGNFLSGLGTRGRGPGEYLGISDFTIDSEGNTLIADGVANKLIEYDSSLRYSSTSGFPFEIEGMACINDGYLIGLALWDEIWPKAGVISVGPDMSNAAELLPRAEFFDANYEISTAKFQNTDIGYFFNKAIDDNVYLLDKQDGHLLRHYYFDFGSETVPDDVRMNIEMSVENGTFEDYTMLCNFVVVGQRYISGCLVHDAAYMDFIADRETGRLYTKDIWKDMDEMFLGYEGDELISVIFPQSEDECLRLKFTKIPLT